MSTFLPAEIASQMPLPSFASTGDLPLGVHCATLPDVLDRLGVGSRQRVVVAGRLERIYRIARETGSLARFIVFGSFVTDKADPNDVDIFMVMEDSFDSTTLSGDGALLFDHSAADSHFGASVFWVRRLAAFGGVEATIEYWQMTRGGGQRGIVEIVEGKP